MHYYKKSSSLRWLSLVGLSLGYSLMYLDMFALIIALPFLQKQFQATHTQTFWVINAYVMAIASASLAGGRLADIFGLRNIFLIGVSLFGLASVGSALSPSIDFLIYMRVLQGLGSAITLSVAASIVYHIFPEETQGKALGYFGLTAVIFVALGPFVGGVFTHFLTWRWIFWLNPIFSGISFVASFILLRGLDEDKDQGARFDYLGFIFLTFALVAFTLAFMQANCWGWSYWLTLALFAFSMISLVIYIYIERRAISPLFDLLLLKKRNFSLGAVIFFFAQFALVANIYYALFLENSLEFNPFIAGLCLLPASFLGIFANPYCGKLVDKFGYKKTLQWGLFIASCGFLWLFATAHFRLYWVFLIGLIFISAMLPFCTIPCYVMLMRSSTVEKRGMVSGVGVTFRQVGAVVCIAFMSFITIHFHRKFDGELSSSIIYAKSFSIAMLMVMVALLIAWLLSFWIDPFAESQTPSKVQ